MSDRLDETPATHTASEGPQPEVRERLLAQDDRAPDTATPATQNAGRDDGAPAGRDDGA